MKTMPWWQYVRDKAFQRERHLRRVARTWCEMHSAHGRRKYRH